MNKIFLISLCISICNLQAQKITDAQLAALQASVDAGIDPYFVNTSDTISVFGPNCITRDVLQDKKGIYWFATWHGIISYNGKVFINHTLKDGLIRFHVVSTFEDSKGNVWFGTARGGLYKYDSKTFKLFTIKDGLADNTVMCMAEDKEGTIWFGTEKGVTKYDGKTFATFGSKEGIGYTGELLCDKTGKLWIGSEGIVVYDGKTFTPFNDKNNQPFKRITALFEDKTGNIWIGTFNGLTIYDGKKFTDHLSDYLTYYITDDKKGNIWLSHAEQNVVHPNLPDQVLYFYDGKTFTKMMDKFEQGDCQIFGKTVDNAGRLWFGTMHGPCCYDGKSFKEFTR